MAKVELRVVKAEETKKDAAVPVANAPVIPKAEMTKIEKLVEETVAADKAAKLSEKRFKDLVKELQPKLQAYGAHTKPALPEDAIMFVGGYKVQWVGAAREAKDDAAGIKFIKDQIAASTGAAKKKWQETMASVVVLREEIDWDAWAKVQDQLPPDLVKAAVTTKSSYHLRYWETNNQECSSCSNPINKNDKFCKHCGTATNQG